TVYYFDETGAEVSVLDFVGGYGSLLFGHNHPELVRTAVANLEGERAFGVQGSIRGETAELAETLHRMFSARFGRNWVSTFGSTGAEAVEMAMKHAELANHGRLTALVKRAEHRLVAATRALRKGSRLELGPALAAYAQEKGIESLPALIETLRLHNRDVHEMGVGFLALERGFHGKTTGAVQLTSNPRYRQPFRRIGRGCGFVKVGSKEDLETAFRQSELTVLHTEVDLERGRIELRESKHGNVAALFVEPIQGEGGVQVLPVEFLRGCRELCDDFGAHLIFDEIQCGMGRTGRFLASEDSGVRADAYLLSKSLGGGLAKISALVVEEKAYQPELGLVHSSTFAEDDHASAIASRALHLLERDPGIMRRCAARGSYLMDGLRALQDEFPGILTAVRGEGLMIGVEFRTFDDIGREGLRLLSVNGMLGYVMMGYLFHEHRIRVAPLLSESTVLRLEPSAYISEKDCDQLLRGLRQLCEVLYKMNIYALTRFMIGEERPGEDAPIESFRSFLPEFSSPPGARKVAFVGHFIDSADLACWDPGYGLFTIGQRRELMRKVYRVNPAHLVDRINVESETGEVVSLHFIGLSITSEIIVEHMRNKDLEPVVKMVQDAVDMAHALGCEAIGLGGYTSIVTNNAKKLESETAALTTGNSLTAGMGFEAILASCKAKGIDLSRSCFAAVGANGNIASVYAELMAERTPEVILIGRPGRERALEAVATRIYTDALRAIVEASTRGEPPRHAVARALERTGLLEPGDLAMPTADSGAELSKRVQAKLGDRAPVRISTSVDAIRDADIILGASNAPGALIYPEMLKPGPIVICDVALPMDTDDSVLESREDVTVLQGGIVKLPRNPDFSVRGIPLPLGSAFACMSETLLLGLSGHSDHYSRGAISKDQVHGVLAMARRNGFTLGHLKKQRSY
ncbi:MAG: aminotransferase class III-fold pyridoxal phosphate-dependent enzyme, partial [Myxococcota bacterium]